MTLRRQIIMMGIVPLVALAVLGSYLSFTKYSSLRSAISTQAYLAEVETATGFIHLLQAERALSAGFVATDGREFGAELRTARAETDVMLDQLPEAAAGLRARYIDVTAMRSQVDALNATVSELGDLYTGVIRDTFAFAQERLTRKGDPVIARLGAGVIALGEAKEEAGMQRAAGALGFGEGVFDQETHDIFVSTGAAERGLLDLAILSLGNVIDPSEVEAALAGSGITQMREMVSGEGIDATVDGSASAQWAAQSGAWAEALREFERQAFAEMSATAQQSQYWAAMLFAGALAVSILSFAATAWMASKLIRSFDSGFRSLSNAIKRLTNGEYDGRSYKQDPMTEIGRMFMEVDKTRDELLSAKHEVEVQNEARVAVIERLDAALITLADGDVSARIDEEFPEAFESLRDSYNRAVARLCEAMQGVQKSARVLQGSSSNLTQSNEDLSTRTASQAAALEETTAALTQLSEMVAGATESAIQANAATTKLNDDAISGGDQVKEAIVAIQEIAEATKKMTGMIGLIEDIAFQTSLLALNAGVEAARAGEAGKGFAVVASEVRALAVRATQTTVEIKDLIGSATERTENGVALVERAGEVFTSITESVSHAASSVENIASDAESRASSIDEIKAAMFDLDRVTQENAAMADDSLQLSEKLKLEADELWQVVAQFNLPGDAPSLSQSATDVPSRAA